jgi:hypothetical protein
VASTKASAKIEYSRRDVFVSSFPGRAAGPLAEPIAHRIRSYSDEDTTEVRCRTSITWKPGELRQWLEVASDFILLYDDDVVGALREAELDKLADTPEAGLELLVVMGVNDARQKAGADERVRLWMAKAESLPVRLRRMAGREDWQLMEDDTRLHWLYGPKEKVLTKPEYLQDKKLLGDDETRLGEKVESFVGHEVQVCKHCGAVHEPR